MTIIVYHEGTTIVIIDPGPATAAATPKGEPPPPPAGPKPRKNPLECDNCGWVHRGPTQNCRRCDHPIWFF